MARSLKEIQEDKAKLEAEEKAAIKEHKKDAIQQVKKLIEDFDISGGDLRGKVAKKLGIK
tara:strand:- start:700 stop:879 length:180 start_codon:yes stop_codon:yes gene_type:complete